MPRGRKKSADPAKPRGDYDARRIKVTSQILGPLALMNPAQVRYAVRRSFQTKEEHQAFKRWLHENDEVVFSHEKVAYEIPK